MARLEMTRYDLCFSLPKLKRPLTESNPLFLSQLALEHI